MNSAFTTSKSYLNFIESYKRFLNVSSVCSHDRTITSSSNYVYPTRFRANVSTYGDTGLTRSREYSNIHFEFLSPNNSWIIFIDSFDFNVIFGKWINIHINLYFSTCFIAEVYNCFIVSNGSSHPFINIWNLH